MPWRAPVEPRCRRACSCPFGARRAWPRIPSRPTGRRPRSPRRASSRRRRARRVRDRSRPRRDHLLARSGRSGRCRRRSIFPASDNVGEGRAVFPAPKRIGSRTAARRSATTAASSFPLKVEPRDPAKPVTLELDAHYAVCEKLCLPARAKLDADPSGRGFALRVRGRGGARRRAARRSSRRLSAQLQADGAGGWRLCAPARPGRRATCSSSRRKAGG